MRYLIHDLRLIAGHLYAFPIVVESSLPFEELTLLDTMRLVRELEPTEVISDVAIGSFDFLRCGKCDSPITTPDAARLTAGLEGRIPKTRYYCDRCAEVAEKVLFS